DLLDQPAHELRVVGGAEAGHVGHDVVSALRLVDLEPRLPQVRQEQLPPAAGAPPQPPPEGSSHPPPPPLATDRKACHFLHGNGQRNRFLRGAAIYSVYPASRPTFGTLVHPVRCAVAARLLNACRPRPVNGYAALTRARRGAPIPSVPRAPTQEGGRQRR